jgi:hypothetical protein
MRPLATRNSAQSAVLRRLAELGGWVSREKLAHGLQWTEQRVDDELADLVVDGSVMFNGRGREYRLGGSQLARQAMQKLVASNGTHQLLARPSKTEPVMHMGLAARAQDYTGSELLVMCELEMPYSDKDPQQVQELCEALTRFEKYMGGLTSSNSGGAA